MEARVATISPHVFNSEKGVSLLEKLVFEEALTSSEPRSNIVGHITLHWSVATIPVYDTAGLGPDAGELPPRENRQAVSLARRR